MPDNGKILSFESPRAPAPAALAQEELILGREEASEALDALIRAMQSCGQDPVTQLAGYLVTDDPTYLPECCHARALARRIGRDKLLEILIEQYLSRLAADTASPAL